MVKFFSDIVQSLIIALIFIIIIEMLLPNNSNKKYIKIISGVYIIFIIVSPILEIFNKEIDLDFFSDLETIQTSTVINQEELKDYYKNSLKMSIKTELESQGYKIKDLNIKLNEDNSEIIKIEIKGSDFNQFDGIKKFLFENYGIELGKIIFS